jgi:hypothetical protein
MGQGHYSLTISAPPRLRVVPLARPVVPDVVAFWFFPPLPSLALTSFREWRARQVVQRKGSRGAAEEKRRRAKGLGRDKATIGPFRKTPKFPSQSPRLRVVPLARPVVPGVVAFWFFPPLPSLAPTSFREWRARQVVQRKGSRGAAETRRRRGDGPRDWEGARPPLDLSAKHRSSPHNLRASAAPRGPVRAARCAWRCRVLGLSPSSIPCTHFVSRRGSTPGGSKEGIAQRRRDAETRRRRGDGPRDWDGATCKPGAIQRALALAPVAPGGACLLLFLRRGTGRQV